MSSSSVRHAILKGEEEDRAPGSAACAAKPAARPPSIFWINTAWTSRDWRYISWIRFESCSISYCPNWTKSAGVDDIVCRGLAVPGRLCQSPHVGRHLWRLRGVHVQPPSCPLRPYRKMAWGPASLEASQTLSVLTCLGTLARAGKASGHRVAILVSDWKGLGLPRSFSGVPTTARAPLWVPRSAPGGFPLSSSPPSLGLPHPRLAGGGKEGVLPPTKIHSRTQQKLSLQLHSILNYIFG